MNKQENLNTPESFEQKPQKKEELFKTLSSEVEAYGIKETEERVARLLSAMQAIQELYGSDLLLLRELIDKRQAFLNDRAEMYGDEDAEGKEEKEEE